MSRTATETQKLSRVAEAEKLKFAGNKNQFIFNSELCGTLDEVSVLLAAKQTEKAEEKVAELSKNLKRRQKAGWLAVKEYLTEELARDPEDERRIRKAQERALKKKKQNVSKKQDRDRNSWLGASRFRTTKGLVKNYRGVGRSRERVGHQFLNP